VRVLLLSNDDVRAVLDMASVVEVLDATYRDLAAGEAVCRPRIDVRIPTPDPQAVYQWGSMEGGSAASGLFAIRVKSDVLTVHEYAGTRTQDKHCVAPGTYCGLVLLFSAVDGEPLAIVHDGVLQHMRVGADSAIGARYAARPESVVLGLLGSGGMARTHVEALRTVLPLERVQVFSPTRRNREAFAAEIAEEWGIEAVAVASPEEVYAGADVVSGCTDALGDVVAGARLEPGTHVTSVGGSPDADVARRAALWLRLGTAPPPVGHERWPADEKFSYVARPQAEAWGDQPTDRDDRGPGAGHARLVLLAQLLSGADPGRRTDREITFSERGNVQGAQFFAVAGLVHERARAAGLGRELPTAWFLQDVRD
jgi:alanine dehydrogenase